MNEQGFISTVVIWIAMALFALGLATISIVKWHRANANARMYEVRSFFIAHSAALMAFQNNFSQEALSFDFEDGHVSLERLQFTPDKTVTIRCRVDIGTYHRQSDVEWLKRGDSWRAVSWQEM